LDILVPIALEALSDNLLAEGNYYPGDLLHSVLQVPPTFWARRKDLYEKLVRCLVAQEDVLSAFDPGFAADRSLIQHWKSFLALFD
jgi:hypothetical protein